MSDLFSNFDRGCFHPIFQHVPQAPQQALDSVLCFVDELDSIVADYYIRVPHSISAIFQHENKIRIDTIRTFDESDPYIQEESLIGPPEMKSDRFWRRNITRLTYFSCQLLLSLFSGKLPINPLNTITFHLFASSYTDEQIIHIQEVFAIGLDPNPQDRYPDFKILRNAFLELRQKLNIHNAAAGKSVTQRIHLPNTEKREICLWMPKYENFFQQTITLPAQLHIGRKSATKKNIKPSDPKFVVSCVEKQEEECHIYQIEIEGDPCLSRNHAVISLDSNAGYAKDLQSTHGVIVFRDANRDPHTSTVLKNGEKAACFSLEDQYIQFGNTFLRIRLI